MTAGRWTASSAGFQAILQVLQTAILARLLIPSDFGLMAIVGSTLAVFWLFSDLGISQALIHYDEVSDEALSSLYWMNLSLGFALMALMLLLSYPLSALYHSPALRPLLQAGSALFPLSAIGQQFRVIAQRDLRFASLAKNEIAANTIGVATAIAVAGYGGGVYALIAGVLSTAASSSLLAWWRLSSGHRPSFQFNFISTKPYLGFGSYLVLEKIANSLYRQADVFAAGAAVGPAQLGLYSVPRDLSFRFAMLVNPIVTRIAFPVMARAKDDRLVLKEVYLQVLRMTSSFNFPVYIALAIFSNEIVALLYGSKFSGAGTYLRVLAAWGLLRSIGNPVGSLLYAVGFTRRAMIWNLAMLLSLPTAYYFAASELGLRGLAFSLLATQVALLVPAWRYLIRPCCGAGLGEFLWQVFVPLALSLTAGACAVIAVSPFSSQIIRISLGTLVGGAAYTALCYKFNLPWLSAMLELLFIRQSRTSIWPFRDSNPKGGE